MIQAKAAGGGINLQNRDVQVTLQGTTVIIGEETITEPGEYEASGIAVLYGDQAALLEWDHLQIVFALSTTKPSAFDKNQFNSADVLLVNQSEQPITKELWAELLAAYEPSVVIIHPQAAIEADLRDSFKSEPVSVVKLTAQSLPTEGRETYLLS